MYAGDTNDARALGLEAADDAFDRAVARLGDAGFRPTETSDGTLAARLRRGDRLARFDTPWDETSTATPAGGR